jgi:fructose-bisphosphate aldolase class 1
VWAGVDSAWEQKKLEARKMLENAAESHTSGARFVGWRSVAQDSLTVKEPVHKELDKMGNIQSLIAYQGLISK